MNEEELRAEYFEEYLRKGLHDIFEAQRRIADYRIYAHGAARELSQGAGAAMRGRSGRLRDVLNREGFSLERVDSGLRTRVDYPVYIRFLDMKKHGNFQIYNRQIWGILYGETFVNMRYEYRQWLERYIRQGLEGCFRDS